MNDILFPKQTKTYAIQHRLAGTKQEYWTLSLVLNGDISRVHTSKSKAYLLDIARNWTK